MAVYDNTYLYMYLRAWATSHPLGQGCCRQKKPPFVVFFPYPDIARMALLQLHSLLWKPENRPLESRHLFVRPAPPSWPRLSKATPVSLLLLPGCVGVTQKAPFA
jgi:hypothetical protein